MENLLGNDLTKAKFGFSRYINPNNTVKATKITDVERFYIIDKESGKQITGKCGDYLLELPNGDRTIIDGIMFESYMVKIELLKSNGGWHSEKIKVIPGNGKEKDCGLLGVK